LKQLILIADMEGTSGIFEENRQALWHEEVFPNGRLWREYGRDCITSDVLAVCEAAKAFGIDEILLYDSHFAGCAEYNVKLEQLPSNLKPFDLPAREFHWRRIRGQAALNPFGLITVGTHARNGEPHAYFPHTVQTPPIKEFSINGLAIGELGIAALCFQGTPYLANIGCAASHTEALELSAQVSCITVKDKRLGYTPTPEETFPLIKAGVLDALNEHANKTAAAMPGPCHCSLSLTEGFHFEKPKRLSWKGRFYAKRADFKAPTLEIALELFNFVRACIRKDQ